MAGLAACNQSGVALGDDPLDNALLDGDPLFAHYQGVTTGARTVADLYGEALRFTGRPVPRALLGAMQASNPPAAPNAVPLSVVSFNVAMLDVSLFGAVQYGRTPYLDARRAVVPELVFSQGYDIIGLQEVWASSDLARFRTVGAARGYTLYSASREGFTDGLVIALRSGLAPRGAATRHAHFTEIDGLEYFPAPGFSRGFLAVDFEHPSLGPTSVYVSHTAAFPSAWRLRMHHAREIGLDVRRNVSPRALLFVLGDLNAAPYYRADTWALPSGGSEAGWYANTLSYPILMHYTGAVDLAVRGRSRDDADLDITAGDSVPNVASASLREPFGAAAFCAAAPANAFTATDCNPLYFQQYAGTEYPARIDFVFGRDPAARMHVAESRVVFRDPIAYGGIVGPPSDHYGQLVRLLVAPP